MGYKECNLMQRQSVIVSFLVAVILISSLVIIFCQHDDGEWFDDCPYCLAHHQPFAAAGNFPVQNLVEISPPSLEQSLSVLDPVSASAGTRAPPYRSSSFSI